MKAVWHWLRSWYAAAGVYRALATHERALVKADTARAGAHARIDAGLYALSRAREEFNEVANRIEIDLEDAARHHKTYDHAITELRAELEVAVNTTIPTLVAANRLLLGRIDADLAVQARRTVMATTPENPNV